jgi:rhodanese-related sulfurtransferase
MFFFRLPLGKMKSWPTLCEVAWLLLLATIPALLTGWLHPHRPDWSWKRPEVVEVTLETATRWGNVLWVDAREASAYATAHVPGAVSLNETSWENLLPDFVAVWQPEKPVVIYCDSKQCDSSRTVALRLRRELALENVFVLKGGWIAWQQTQP